MPTRVPPTSVIIVAGGSGSRFGSAIPKQFVPINGIPMIVHTIRKFLSCEFVKQLIVVLPKTELERWAAIANEYALQDIIEITIGGATRVDSVENGLQLVTSNTIVAIHDAARPLLSSALIENCCIAAVTHHNAIPAVACADSLRRVLSETTNEIVDRSAIVQIQTPQCFNTAELKACFAKKGAGNYTDDASIWEAAGHAVHLVEGEKYNIKITTADDLVLAAALLAQ